LVISSANVLLSLAGWLAGHCKSTTVQPVPAQEWTIAGPIRASMEAHVLTGQIRTTPLPARARPEQQAKHAQKMSTRAQPHHASMAANANTQNSRGSTPATAPTRKDILDQPATTTMFVMTHLLSVPMEAATAPLPHATAQPVGRGKSAMTGICARQLIA
jgi:hypothetical protein